jgi:hypothetical protein
MLSPRENPPSMVVAPWTETASVASMVNPPWTDSFAKVQPPLVGDSGCSGVANIGTHSGPQGPRSQS